MLIGIDMLGIQSPESGDRQSGRFARQLVAGLLAADSTHRFILYTHEGFSTDRVPKDRSSLRVSLAPVPGGSNRLRPTIQRVIDQNPDGLDWLLLLDPFEPNYCGLPPESPLNELKIASLVLDLVPSLADDRRLAPLRRHDAILAVSDATASECRRRLGAAAWRVSKLGVACDPAFAGETSMEPLTRVSGEELGQLGIHGPFLLASMVGGADRSNLSGIIDAYHRLPFEHRRRHQLVIAGQVPDPWAVVAYLHDRGCAEGLVLVGEVSEDTLRTLYRYASAFVSPSIEEGCGLSLVEAMLCGSAVLAGTTGAQPDIVGKAGLLADPTDPVKIAEQLSLLLGDANLEFELRSRAVARAAAFGWEPVVQAVLHTLQADEMPETSKRQRIDQAHLARPRIAIFVDPAKAEVRLTDLAEQVPAAWSGAYNVDLYLDSDQSANADNLPSEFGGFDARQFDRNDGILRYHAVVYRLGSLDDFDAKLNRLRSRPGLVLLGDETSILRLGLESAEESSKAIVLGQLRELLLTSSRLGVRSAEAVALINADLPEFVDRVFLRSDEPATDSLPDAAAMLGEIERCAAEVPKGPGRRPRRPGPASRGMVFTPHSLRSSSNDDEVTSRSR